MSKRRDKRQIKNENINTAKRESRREFYLICALIILATVAVYWQVGGFKFISNCDDNIYVQDNQWVRGLQPDAIRWAFTSGSKVGATWMPMVWMSYMIDGDICASLNSGSTEPDPRVYHTTNLLLHIACALLLFAILSRMTGWRWGAAFVAMLFAVHPLHVESVAWIAERKDVLSTFFWMLTMLAYLRYIELPGRLRYALVLIAFIFGLMSKPMLVSLPLIFIFLDFWPLRRMSQSRIAGLIIEKIPLLILSAAASVVALITQRSAEALTPLSIYPLGIRLANASVSSIVYIRQMIWPSGLAFYVPHPGESLPVWQVGASAVLLIALTAGATYAAKRKPYITVGWFWYLITLLPVIGIVQIGRQAYADRYTYIPLTGLFIILTWGISDLSRRVSASRVLPGLACIMILTLIFCAHRQAGYWKDSTTIYQRNVDLIPINPIAHANLGFAFWDKHDKPAAIRHFRTALEQDSTLVGAHIGLGYAFEDKGNFDAAIEQYTQAVRLEPKSAQAHNNLGVLLERKGDLKQALTHFEAAAHLCPDNELMRENAEMLRERIGVGR